MNGNLQADRAPDTYYEVFGGQQGSPVYSIAEARSVSDHSGLRLPRVYLARGLDPLELLASSQRASILRLLGALVSFRALTNGQAATITGNAAYADPRSPAVANLFRSGLIDLSPAHLDHGLGDVGHGAAVYQLGDARGVRALRDHLTYAEWLALTGNRPLPASRVNVRHDVLAAELGLRLSHLRAIGAVLGPHFSTLRDPHCPQLRHARQGGPDLVVVTETGLRITFEVTATIGQRFTRKVEHWSEWLAENPLEQTGVVVVFLVAPSLQDIRRRGDWVRAETYRAVAQHVALNPGSLRDPVAARIGVATWREWFPGAWQSGERFRRLTVDRATGPGRLWEQADIASRNPEWSNRLSMDPRDVIRNAAFLSQSPPWLRARHRPRDLNADLLREHAGFPPALPPRRPGAASREPGVGQGATADSYLPSHLLGTSEDAVSDHHRVTAPHRSPSLWPPPASPPPPVVKRRPKPRVSEAARHG